MTDTQAALVNPDTFPVGLVRCNGLGRVTYANAQMFEWLDIGSNEDIIDRPFYSFLSPAGRIYFETHLRPMLALEGSINEISIELTSTKSKRTRVYLSGTVERTADGAVQALNLVCFSGADRQRYEKELLLRRRKAEAFEAMVAASPDAIINIDPRQKILTWNAAAETMFGHSSVDAIGQTLFPLIIAEEDRIANSDHLKAVAKGDAITFNAVRKHKNGSDIPVEISMARITDERGVYAGAISTLRDISERQRAEETIDVLNKEVLHRAKNLLTVASSLATMTAKTTDRDSFPKVFGDRLRSMGNSLSLLVERNWQPISLKDLIARQLDHIGQDTMVRVSIDGPTVELGPGKAETLGMAIFELSTNALKYGALSLADGKIRITWRHDKKQDAIVLDWIETLSKPYTAPTKKGFGSRLTGTLLEQGLDAEVTATYGPTGLHWTCVFPA